VVSKKLRVRLQRFPSGRSDANISFKELINLLFALGFEERVRGDHHILWKNEIPEIMNLQPIGIWPSPIRSSSSAVSLRITR
jgi:hypothetical protein